MKKGEMLFLFVCMNSVFLKLLRTLTDQGVKDQHMTAEYGAGFSSFRMVILSLEDQGGTGRLSAVDTRHL